MSQLRVYNTLSRQLEDFAPQTPGHVKMYVCGMTVYDYCHIGHARAMLSFDMIYRWLCERGYTVTFVRNYTDVDDKIISRASELGEAPLALSERFIDALNDDLERLGLALPDVQPKVSEHIDDIIMTAFAGHVEGCDSRRGDCIGLGAASQELRHHAEMAECCRAMHHRAAVLAPQQRPPSSRSGRFSRVASRACSSRQRAMAP